MKDQANNVLSVIARSMDRLRDVEANPAAGEALKTALLIEVYVAHGSPFGADRRAILLWKRYAQQTTRN